MNGVVWLLDNYSEDVVKELESKGYLVRKFTQQTQNPMQYDERPDMVFFSEITVRNVSLFSKIHQMYPGVLAMSVPSLLPADGQ
ncbi:MAG TPA: hypothetical protein VIN08_21835 [Ohtaekwangia sp.]|uniref:hypothetical protein n=1 Tax=Ohtaekwangia sp. TaxID=2066019 RepID=UPI002F9449FF